MALGAVTKAGIIINEGKNYMKKALFAMVLTVTVCSMSYAGGAMADLKGSASVEGAAAIPEQVIGNPHRADSFTTTVMELPDIRAAIAIFDRVRVKGEAENADCYSTQAVIESSVRGFNPAKWYILFGDAQVMLTGPEIQSMITMFDRLHVASTRTADINLVSRVVIKSRTCNMRPAVWTAFYKKNPKFD